MTQQPSQPPIYLDNAATSRPHLSVVRAVAEALTNQFGNPSSRHRVGLAADERLQWARGVVARKLAVAPKQVMFTSGGTEANALAMLGAARRRRGAHVLLSAVEHPSMQGNACLLEQQGYEVERLPVTPGGFVEPDEVARRLRPQTSVVALMHVCNETGIVQPVADVARLVRRQVPRCRMVVDAVQSFCSLPFTLDTLGAHLMTLSGHKLNGPKGIGAVVRAEGVTLPALWGGGSQEAGMRPGTENMPAAVGLARAVELSRPDPDRLAGYCDDLAGAVMDRFPGSSTVGDPGRRAAHIVAMTVPSLPAEVLVNALEAAGVCVSAGSACHSRRSLASHVAKAMGLPADAGLVRFSPGSLTTDDEVTRAVDIIRNLEI